MFFGTNVYGWTLLAKRNNHEWNLGSAMAEAKRAGVRGWEHSFRRKDEVQPVANMAKRQGLEMRSAYIYGSFHRQDIADEATSNALEIAEALRAVGVRNLIFNPEPLPSGAEKTDKEIATQSDAINNLGRALTAAGSRFLYHTHDPEMKSNARELHYMLDHSDPTDVGFCLDVHWVYRGANNSQEVLHEIISQYANRIELIHLRQSVGGVWTESIGAGDIDYPKLTRHLADQEVKAIMVMELALEKGTPAVLSGEQAHAESLEYLEPLLEHLSAEEPKDVTAPWRIYLFGSGAIAHRHAAATEGLKNVELFAADPSKAARDSFKAVYPQTTMFEDAEAMVASSAAQEHDIVILAVPPWLHHPAALAAFHSGRHVLSEKPVARSETELAEMLAASHSARRLFGDCSVRFLGNKILHRARQLIESGEIGSPYHARLVNRNPRSRPGVEYQPESTWFLDKEKAGGGTIYDWGVYDLTMFFDVLRPIAATVHHAWIATPPTAVDPPQHPITVETHAGAVMTLELESGAKVAFEYERASGFHGEPQSILNVDGTTGGLSWQWIPSFKAVITDLADYVGSKDKPAPQAEDFNLVHYTDVDGKVDAKVEKFPGFGWDVIYARPLLSFLSLIEGRKTDALPEARIEFNFAVIAGIYKSAAEGVSVQIALRR